MRGALMLDFELAGERTQFERLHHWRDFEHPFDLVLDQSDCSCWIGAAPDLDMDAKHIQIFNGHRLAFEVVDRRQPKHQVFELAVVDVDAANLEKTAGALRVSHHRKHREWPRARHVVAQHHEIAGHPAQERRDVVGVERGHHERADLAVGDRLPGVRVDHLDEEEIAPNPEAVGLAVLRRHHAGFGHAE